MIARTVSLRSRSVDGEPLTAIRDDWDNAKIVVVICDMWGTTQCVSAARRVAEMAPRVNEVAGRLRQDGALIVHAHRDPRGHRWGNEQMIADIERYWCPTLTSDQLAGGAPFQFPIDGIAQSSSGRQWGRRQQ